MSTNLKPGRYKSYGCKHYKRKCNVVAKCCNKVYPCHLCHDEKEKHQFERATCQVVCKICQYHQTPDIHCDNCFLIFGRYFCKRCIVYDDEDKLQFHCVGCGLCREGGCDHFFHCPNCDVCLPLSLVEHKCIENVSKSDCPLCLDDLHTSVDKILVLKCGHLIHDHCWVKLKSKFMSKCPTCRLAIGSEEMPCIALSAG